MAPRRPDALVSAGGRGGPAVRWRNPGRPGRDREDLHRRRRGPRALTEAAGARAGACRAPAAMGGRGTQDRNAASGDDPRSAQQGAIAGFEPGTGDHRRIPPVSEPGNPSLPHTRTVAARAERDSAHGDPGRERNLRRGAPAPPARARRRAGRARARQSSIARRADIDCGALPHRAYRRGSHRPPARSHLDDVALTGRPRGRPRTRGHRRPRALTRSLRCLAGSHFTALGAGIESRGARHCPAPISEHVAARRRGSSGRQSPGSRRPSPRRTRHDRSARDVGTLR